MDVRQLTYFVEVAKHRSFTKASHALYVSQPSISRMIKSLEDELGVILLDRSERDVLLTDVGELIYNQSLIILESMNQLTQLVDEVMNAKRGKIQMGLMPTIGAILFPTLIAGFKRSYPNIDIQMVEYSAKQVEAQLELGNIDFGVTVLPVNTQLYNSISLLSEDLVVIANIDHWVADRETVRLFELKNEPFILFTKEFVLHDVVLKACLDSEFEPKAAYITSLWDLLCEMVASQLGISLIPRSMAVRLNHLPVRVVTLDGPRIDWELVLAYRKDKYLPYACRVFITYLRQHLQSNGD